MNIENETNEPVVYEAKSDDPKHHLGPKIVALIFRNKEFELSVRGKYCKKFLGRGSHKIECTEEHGTWTVCAYVKGSKTEGNCLQNVHGKTGDLIFRKVGGKYRLQPRPLLQATATQPTSAAGTESPSS